MKAQYNACEAIEEALSWYGCCYALALIVIGGCVVRQVGFSNRIMAVPRHGEREPFPPFDRDALLSAQADRPASIEANWRSSNGCGQAEVEGQPPSPARLPHWRIMKPMHPVGGNK